MLLCPLIVCGCFCLVGFLLVCFLCFVSSCFFVLGSIWLFFSAVIGWCWGGIAGGFVLLLGSFSFLPPPASGCSLCVTFMLGSGMGSVWGWVVPWVGCGAGSWGSLSSLSLGPAGSRDGFLAGLHWCSPRSASSLDLFLGVWVVHWWLLRRVWIGLAFFAVEGSLPLHCLLEGVGVLVTLCSFFLVGCLASDLFLGLFFF